ncbi:MAG: adenylate/guanylate cyclase domain-containing protein [Acidimicrobiia bacterium]
MCGFTRMNDTLGDEEAVAVLSAFRTLVRQLAPDHGIRVGQWRGDGAMFVAGRTPQIVNGMLDLVGRLESADIVLPLRIGIASGDVLLFEGDDFIGMSINLASRLCDVAGPGEILCTADVVTQMGSDFEAVPLGARSIPGLVAPLDIWRIAIPEREDELPLSFVE